MDTVSAQHKTAMLNKILQVRDTIENFCNKESFPFIVVAIAFIFHVFALDLVGILVFGLFSAFAVLFFKDTRSGLVTICSAVFIVSIKNGPGYTSFDKYYGRKDVLLPIICVAGVVLLAMAIRCVKNHKNYKASKMILPTAILAVSFILSGIGSKYYSESVWFGVFVGASYIVLYVVFSGCLDNCENLFNYFATVFTAICLLIAVQVVEVYATHLIKGGTFNKQWKDKIIFGWGVSNIAGEMMVFFIPFVMYKIEQSRKHYNLYHAIALFCMTMVAFTLNRAGLLFGVPMFVVLWVRLLIKTPHKNAILLMVAIYFSLALVCLIALTSFTEISKLFMYFRELLRNIGEEGVTMSKRDQLWDQAWKFFLKSPIFGEGYASAFHEPISLSHANMFQTLTHNFFIQAVGSGGIMGTLTSIFYVFCAVRAFAKKYEGKFHIVCFGILFLGISLFDTTYFITYSVMFFVFIIAIMEKLIKNKESKDEKN
ncbi:MAG: O-antigen ligase family protein [Clostridia bacterium]|nr:O-antigen ligase family protein [Clostridia bacterium]